MDIINWTYVCTLNIVIPTFRYVNFCRGKISFRDDPVLCLLLHFRFLIGYFIFTKYIAEVTPLGGAPTSQILISCVDNKRLRKVQIHEARDTSAI